MKHRPDRSLLEHYRNRYSSANYQKRKSIIDDFCLAFSYHRKAAIRLLNGVVKDSYGKRAGPKKKYEEKALEPILKIIWLATDQMCSKRLKVALPLWMPHYENTYGEIEKKLKQQLEKISPSTIDRLLKPLRLRYRKRYVSTRPGSLLKTQIPIKTDHWDIARPGFVEADTVAHCGNSLAGDFIWSITLTDIFTGWTEIRATWNKGSEGVVNQIKAIESCLPFTLLGFDCDNGSEFLNHHLLQYFTSRKTAVQFTRSRPYRKDDNAHVEQKNWTHVRQLFGYDRLSDPRLVSLMNDVYANEWSLLQNYYCPTMKLIEKIKVNSKYKKRYEMPKTPYQRLLENKDIDEGSKTQLKKRFETLNPLHLKKEIERKLKIIFSYVKVTGNMRQRI